ncbi:uncharacterized protein [Dermacentor andersoni]|uniref:uncharacterized protein n=1 Tax=Dermacentor andersoni TaxID=34620 RepID=UPI002415CA25|nr:uncharacterized protein LOC129387356 [Dermacentor andersoni]
MKLGAYVTLLDTEDKLALARAACGGEVRRRAKRITSLHYEVACKLKAQFKYMLNHRLQEMHKTDELLKQYPTTDRLGKLLGDVGSFFACYRPLTRDICIIAKRHHRAFEYPMTEKLCRIAARVNPGPEYLLSLVAGIEDFLEK